MPRNLGSREMKKFGVRARVRTWCACVCVLSVQDQHCCTWCDVAWRGVVVVSQSTAHEQALPQPPTGLWCGFSCRL